MFSALFSISLLRSCIKCCSSDALINLNFNWTINVTHVAQVTGLGNVGAGQRGSKWGVSAAFKLVPFWPLDWIESKSYRNFVWYQQTTHRHPNKYIWCRITPSLYYCETLHYTWWGSVAPVRLGGPVWLRPQRHQNQFDQFGPLFSCCCYFKPCWGRTTLNWCVRRRWCWGSGQMEAVSICAKHGRRFRACCGTQGPTENVEHPLASRHCCAVNTYSEHVQWTIVPVHRLCSPARWTLLWTSVNGALSQWLRQISKENQQKRTAKKTGVQV